MSQFYIRSNSQHTTHITTDTHMKKRYITHTAVKGVFKASRLTQGAFAKLLHVRRETVNKWLQGSQAPNQAATRRLNRLSSKVWKENKA